MWGRAHGRKAGSAEEGGRHRDSTQHAPGEPVVVETFQDIEEFLPNPKLVKRGARTAVTRAAACRQRFALSAGKCTSLLAKASSCFMPVGVSL